MVGDLRGAGRPGVLGDVREMLEEGSYGGGFVEGCEVVGCKGWPALGGRGRREDRGGGDVRGKGCEEVVEGVECCESLREGVGTHGDGIRSVGLLWLYLELVFGGFICL